ncbi:MAG: calcium/proton exchanger [Dehalococcoidia bacterium]
MKLTYLLLFAPFALLGRLLSWSPEVVFAFSFLGLVPLASKLGEATEQLTVHVGPRAGGLLNATFGNTPELVLFFALLRSGQLDIVKASITGSIMTSLLLVVGTSQVVAGLKGGVQRFNKETAGMAAGMMTLAVIGLIVPTLFSLVQQVGLNQNISTEFSDPALDNLSFAVAIVLALLYVLYLVFQFMQGPAATDIPAEVEAGEVTSAWSIRRAVLVLVAATLGIAVLSEILSDVVEPVGDSLGLSPLFMGVILLPLVSNVSEMLVGTRLARRGQLDLAFTTSTSSATQVALFVAPVLVLISPLFGPELTLSFGIFEVVGLALVIFTVTLLLGDGLSNWLEGAQLLALYIILALWFLFYDDPVVLTAGL